MPQYYDLDLNGISLREFRRISPGIRGIRNLIFLKLRLIPGVSQFPVVRPEGILRQQFDQFPEAVQADLRPAIDAALAAGLTTQFFYQPVPVNEFNAADIVRGVVLLAADRRFFAILGWAQLRRMHLVRQRTLFSCRTLLTCGDIVVTANDGPRFNAPPRMRVESVMQGSPLEVVAAHRRRLDRLAAESIVPVSEDSLEDILVKQSQLLVDDLLRRGLLRPR